MLFKAIRQENRHVSELLQVHQEENLFHTEHEKGSCKGSDWTEKEESALVQYLCLFWEDAYINRWPTTKNMDFWNSCAEAVNSTCNSARTGVSCIFLSLICMNTIYLYAVIYLGGGDFKVSD